MPPSFLTREGHQKLQEELDYLRKAGLTPDELRAIEGENAAQLLKI